MDRGNKPILATMPSPDFLWNQHVDDHRPEKLGTLKDHLEMLRLSKGRRLLILNGSMGRRERYRDLLFALLLKIKRNRTPIMIQDATWEPRSEFLEQKFPFMKKIIPTLARFVVSLIDAPHVRYVVLSTSEVRSFGKTWGVDPARVVFLPFPNTLHSYRNMPVHDEGYLFAGGNSARDYGLLVRALEGTNIPTTVATKWKPSKNLHNVKFGLTSHDDYMKLLANCRAAVFPMRKTVRSSGQQSYLNAMGLGKAVIVPDTPGVRDYIIDGVTGVIVPSDPLALRAAILHVMDPTNAEFYAEMGRRAKKDVWERFTEEHFRHGLLYHAGAITREQFEQGKAPGSASSWVF